MVACIGSKFLTEKILRKKTKTLIKLFLNIKNYIRKALHERHVHRDWAKRLRKALSKWYDCINKEKNLQFCNIAVFGFKINFKIYDKMVITLEAFFEYTTCNGSVCPVTLP